MASLKLGSRSPGSRPGQVTARMMAIALLGSLLVTLAPAPTLAATPGSPATALTAGAYHNCALLQTGGVTCWGEDLSGQLGNGPSTQSVQSPPAPIALPAGRTATAIAAGAFHTCALLDNGTVTCWGEDSDGQLGNGTPDDAVDAPPTPITLPTGRTATAIAAGEIHTCALLDNGTVTCWGDDGDGQLGNGPPLASVDVPSAPITMPGGRTATAIAAGAFHTCALLDNNQITCWGLEEDGQLGKGLPLTNLNAPSTPIALPAGRTATAVVAGAFHTCALLDNNQITCWGDDSDGQLGNGAPLANLSTPPTPITLPTGRTATAVIAGAFHTCALLDNNQITCWGDDSDGQLGNGAPLANISTPPTPITLPTGRTATAVAAGEVHTCALLDNGQFTCWGDDSDGQLGNGATLGSVSQPGAPIGTPRAADPDIVTQTPARFYETRPNLTTIDGLQNNTGARTAKQITTINIAGRNNIPTNAAAAIVNITAINPTGDGYITIFPCNQTQPGASTLNYTTNQIIANGATVKLDPNGNICVYTHKAMHLIIDVTGYLE